MSTSSTPARVPEQEFTGKTMLVTGNGTLALRIARAARDRGARVAWAAARDDDGTLHGIARFPGAIDSESAADELVDAAVARLAHLDFIVLQVSAAPLGDLHDVALGEWCRAVTDPLRQLFWLTRRIVEELLGAGTGARVVVVLQPASNGARNEVLEDALRTFARGFAREYGSRALVCNAVLPAHVAAGARTAALLAIVDLVLFLASPAASFVNGETLIADPGNHRQEPDDRDA